MIKTHTGKSYNIIPFSKSRKNITLVLHEGKRKHVVHALLEFDVTDALRLIKARKHKGNDISFTGWLVKCVAQAAYEHKEVNCYRQGKRKIIVFDEVDVPITMEREVNGEQRPIPYIIRNAQTKSLDEITTEIRKVQQQDVNEESQILGLPLNMYERAVIKAPQWVKKIALMILRNHGKLKKQYMGTIGVTSIGMLGNFPGWVIPLGGPVAMLVAVGGIQQKPGVFKGKIAIRQFLHVTIAVDHDLIDGGPLARFVNRVTELIESAYQLT